LINSELGLTEGACLRPSQLVLRFGREYQGRSQSSQALRVVQTWDRSGRRWLTLSTEAMQTRELGASQDGTWSVIQQRTQEQAWA
jgi:hypothetical protein